MVGKGIEIFCVKRNDGVMLEDRCVGFKLEDCIEEEFRLMVLFGGEFG